MLDGHLSQTRLRCPITLWKTTNIGANGGTVESTDLGASFFSDKITEENEPSS